MALKFIALHYFHRDTTLAIAVLDNSVGGVKVSIVAFQAIDPGSIPGWRTFWTPYKAWGHLVYGENFFFSCYGVGGVKVSIVAFQAIDPGSIPGWRIILESQIGLW